MAALFALHQSIKAVVSPLVSTELAWLVGGVLGFFCREIQEGFGFFIFFFFFLPNKAFRSPLGTPNVQLLLKHTLQSQGCTASSTLYRFGYFDGLLLWAITLPPPTRSHLSGKFGELLREFGETAFLQSENTPGVPGDGLGGRTLPAAPVTEDPFLPEGHLMYPTEKSV